MHSPRLIGDSNRDTPRPSRWPSALAVLATAAAGGLFGMWLANRTPSPGPGTGMAPARAPAATPLPNVVAELDAVLERRTNLDAPASDPAAAIGAPPVVDSPAVLGFQPAGDATREAVRRAANWRPPAAGAGRDATRQVPPVRFAYAAARGVPILLRAPPTPMPQSEATMVRLPSAASIPTWLQTIPEVIPPATPARAAAVEPGNAAEAPSRPPAKTDPDAVVPQVAPLRPKPLPIQVAAARAAPTQAPTAIPTAPPAPSPPAATQHTTVLPALPGTAGAIVAVTPAPPLQPTPLPAPVPAAGLQPPAAPPSTVAVAPPPAASIPIVVPMAPPVAPPPIPFAYIGHFAEQDGEFVAFLAAGDRLYSVKPGDVVEDDYRIDHVEPNRLSITYLPMKLKQSLSLSAASSRGGGTAAGKE